MQSKAEGNRVLSSLWSARIIPWVLIGAVGYATYVLVVPLSVNYLLKKHDDYGAAISILVVYFIFFALMAASFFRLVYVTMADPPYVPLGASAPSARRDRISYKNTGGAKHAENGIAMGEYEAADASAVAKAQSDPDSPGLELFYTKDVFICEMDGRPSWCSSCANWKPDRAHHCSSSGRCIIKMDHFCPWIGGPIGENNFKFFLQFNGYAAFYCTHLLVVMAIYIHQQLTTEGGEINNHFAAIIALAGMFGLFTSSMFGTCVYLAMSNLTQVEKLGSKTRAYQLAVLKPSSKELQHVNLHESPLLPYSEITYPLDNGQNPYAHRWDIPSLNTNTSSQVPPSATSHVSQPPQKIPDGSTTSPSSNTLPDLSLIPENNTSEGSTSPVERAMNSPVRVQHHNLVQPLQQASSGGPQPDPNSDDVTRHAEVVSSRDIVATRTFAVLGMETGENPWDLGSRLLNLETVMGTSIFDYLFPVRRSPCCNHEDPESYYDLGPAVDIVKSKYNFMNAEDICENGGRRRSKRNGQSSRLMPQQS